jgi:hypothetical protein
MPMYRFTFFRDEMMVGSTDLDLEDDAAAIESSQALSLGGPVEIHEVRLVAKVEPAPTRS